MHCRVTRPCRPRGGAASAIGRSGGRGHRRDRRRRRTKHLLVQRVGLPRGRACVGNRRFATSAPGLGSPLPHRHQDQAHRCQICTGAGLTPCHICTGVGLTPAASAPGLGSPLPHLRRYWARRCHICTGTRARRCHICIRTRLAAATSVPGRDPLLPRKHTANPQAPYRRGYQGNWDTGWDWSCRALRPASYAGHWMCAVHPHAPRVSVL